MICRNCGTKIKDDCKVCPICHVKVNEEPTNESIEVLDDDWEEFHLEKKKDTAKQKKRKLIAAITALSLAITAIIIVIVVVVFSSMGKSSFTTQMEKGEDLWKNADYEAAIAAFETAVDKAEDDASKSEVLCKLASVYIEAGDDNSAIFYYEAAAELGLLNAEDVSTMVSLYEKKSDVNAIRKLSKTYSNSETESIFSKHLLNQPIFSYKSGTYNELLTVDITTDNNEQIFYTLDNTQATQQSTPYAGPLQIGEGVTVVRAVALNANGALSDEVITTYEVNLDVPVTPVITPETGSYSEATKITFTNVPTNCKAYYTIDGTVPTAESMEYTKPFDMMLGNYVIMAVYINKYTGMASQTVMKIYDLGINGKFSWAQASGSVTNRLQETGELAEGENCTLLPVTVRKIGANNYYIVKRYNQTEAGLKEQGNAYAVDVNTGVVFRAQDNGNDEFNLSGF